MDVPGRLTDGATDAQVRAAAADLARTCYGRLMALLASTTRDLALAEAVPFARR